MTKQGTATSNWPASKGRSNRARISASKLLAPLFVCGFAAGPLYVLPSGLPQPADVLLLIWAALMIFLGRVFVPHRFGALWILLVTNIALVSLIWTMFLANLSILTHALFYIYNLVLGIALYSLISTDLARARVILRQALYLSILASAVLLAVNFSVGAPRQLGGFNNPNQLGFYSLLQLSMLTMLYSRQDRLPVWFWIAGSCAVLLTLLSSSLVASAGVVLVMLGLIVRFRLVTRPLTIAASLSILMLLAVLIVQSGLGAQLLDQWDRRFNVAGRKIEGSIEERSFDRLLDYPQHLLFGAAEGALSRFGEGANEIHSGPLTMLFSYGIIGFSLLIGIFWSIARRARAAELLILMGPLVYITTHQGLRSTMFWMFLVVLYCYKAYNPVDMRGLEGPRLSRMSRASRVSPLSQFDGDSGRSEEATSL